jgi:mono/diheme cytochrome c family protein
MPQSQKPRKKSPTAQTDTPAGGISVKLWFYGFIAIMIIGGGVLFLQAKPETKTTHLEVFAPELQGIEVKGGELFATNCAACHGPNAAGSEKGPPFVHKVYARDHHVDGSFYNAVKRGVQAHHWPYGNMPAIEGVSDDDVTAIVAYVRKVQTANGMK